MGLCCSFLKTVLHLPQNQSAQRSLEIAQKIDDIAIPKETNVVESSSKQNVAVVFDPDNKKGDKDRICINLFPIPSASSAYHKSTGRSLNLENDKISQEKEKIDNTKKSNTISLIDKESNLDSPPENKKESETTIKIRKDELVMPAELMEKINKIITKKEVNHPHANSANDKGKSLSLGDVVNKDQNPDEEIKEEKEPLFEEKKSVSPKLNNNLVKDGDTKQKKQETGKDNKNIGKQLPNQAENQNFNDKNKKKIENPQPNGRTTETTIKSSDKNIMINLKEIDIMTEKAGGNESPVSPKKSLLKYKTIGDERKKSVVKKNVKFKGVPIGGNSKKQRGSSQNQKSPIK